MSCVSVLNFPGRAVSKRRPLLRFPNRAVIHQALNEDHRKIKRQMGDGGMMFAQDEDRKGKITEFCFTLKL